MFKTTKEELGSIHSGVTGLKGTWEGRAFVVLAAQMETSHGCDLCLPKLKRPVIKDTTDVAVTA